MLRVHCDKRKSKQPNTPQKLDFAWILAKWKCQHRFVCCSTNLLLFGMSHQIQQQNSHVRTLNCRPEAELFFFLRKVLKLFFNFNWSSWHGHGKRWKFVLRRKEIWPRKHYWICRKKEARKQENENNFSLSHVRPFFFLSCQSSYYSFSCRIGFAIDLPCQLPPQETFGGKMKINIILLHPRR